MWWMALVFAAEPVLLEMATVGSAAADLDDDGLVDLIEGTNLGPVVRWNLGGGFGDREPWGAVDEGIPGGPFVAAVDLDGDGHVDVCSAQPVAVAFGLQGDLLCTMGTGSRTPGDTVSRGTVVGPVAFRDLDADGDVDILRAEDGLLVAEYNDGTGVVASRVSIATDWLEGMLLADLDGDDLPEAVTLSSSYTLSVYDLSPNGISLRQTMTVYCDGEQHFQALDVDADGDDDLMVCGEPLELALSSAGTLGAPVAPPLTLGRGVTYDADGDGIIDLLDYMRRPVVAGEGVAASSLVGPNGNADRTFTLRFDADGDGEVELTTANYGSRYFAANDGPRLRWRRVSSGAIEPAGVSLADIDRDGRDDLVVAHRRGLYWRPSLGDGTFGPAVDVTRRATATRLGAPVTDIDGDGWVDVVTLRATDWRTRAYLRWGSANGFLEPEEVAEAWGAWSVDLDLDGVDDEVLLADDDTLYTLDATGARVDQVDASSTLMLGWGAAAGDLDGDGLVDIAWAGEEGVALALGSGALPIEYPVVTGLGTEAVWVTDATGDGLDDLVVGLIPEGEPHDMQVMVLTLNPKTSSLDLVGSFADPVDNLLARLASGEVAATVGQQLVLLEPTTFTQTEVLHELPERGRPMEFVHFDQGDIDNDGLIDAVATSGTEVWLIRGE